jgi:hypothetical protein
MSRAAVLCLWASQSGLSVWKLAGVMARWKVGSKCCLEATTAGDPNLGRMGEAIMPVIRANAAMIRPIRA